MRQGVLKALNVNKITKAGCTFKFWVADWFAQLNNKMGGDLKKIQQVGKYMVEVWKAVGMDLEKVQFLSASEEINKQPDAYWTLVMDIAAKNNLKRIVRCSQIMGRSETDELSAAQIFYPCMQCADIFFLKVSQCMQECECFLIRVVAQADICQLGMDQRKVNVLAREYCDQIKRKLKPVILSHPMMPGLLQVGDKIPEWIPFRLLACMINFLQGQEKMSKSDPNSAIFMEDSETDVNSKIRRAFCPPNEIAANPCIAYVRHIVLPWFGQFTVSRKPENGGDKCSADPSSSIDIEWLSVVELTRIWMY